MHQFSSLVSITPVVRSTNTILSDKEVLWIIDVLVRALLDTIDDLKDQPVSQLIRGHFNTKIPASTTYTRFEIDEDSSGNVSGIVGLVEEDILAVTTFRSKVL